MIRRSVNAASRRRAPLEVTFDVAALAFLAVLVIALVLFVVLGRSQWFFHDEWDFLVNRHAGSLDDLFRPHNEHWSTLPILVFRTLWRLFGLRTYVPYQLIAIVLHLTTAALLRVVMRRAAVNAWIATAAASLFALFGAGDRDILVAFQMAWSASLALGLTHLILADHDGPIDRRDVLGLLAGLAAMLCSGVAVTMVLVVGLSALIRRGSWPAVFHTAPLGLLYLAWWFAFADRYSLGRGGSPGTVLRFVWTGLKTTFGEMGQLPGVGLALAVLVVAGLLLAWHDLARNELRRRAASPVALLVGALIFLAVAGLGRAALFGPQYASSSRYLYVVAALCLPALAVAADAFLRRWRAVGVAAAALLVVGIPGNVNLVVRYDEQWPASARGQKDLMLAVAPGPVCPRGATPPPTHARTGEPRHRRLAARRRSGGSNTSSRLRRSVHLGRGQSAHVAVPVTTGDGTWALQIPCPRRDAYLQAGSSLPVRRPRSAPGLERTDAHRSLSSTKRERAEHSLRCTGR